MRKWLKIIGIIVASIILVTIIWEYMHLQFNSEKEVYILPKGFRGVVLIAYNQKDGLDDVKQNGK